MDGVTVDLQVGLEDKATSAYRARAGSSAATATNSSQPSAAAPHHAQLRLEHRGQESPAKAGLLYGLGRRLDPTRRPGRSGHRRRL